MWPRISILAMALCVGISTMGDFAVAPGSGVPIEVLFAQASLVCNCYVDSIQEEITPIEIRGRTSQRHHVTAHVVVRDLYKQDGPQGMSFSVQYVMDEQQGIRVAGSRLGLAKGESALLFVVKNATNTYEFADPFIGVVQFVSLPNQEGSPSLLKLQNVLASLAREDGSKDQLNALQVLLGFQHITQTTISVVTPLSESPDPNIALTAIGILLRTKSATSVQRLQRYLAAHTSETEPLALYVIGPELSEIRSEEALAVLELLSQSKFRPVKSGAMDAIRGIKSPKSIPFLMAKLSDPDKDVQYVALISAAEILGKYEDNFAPSMYLFDQKPQYYLGLWKQWWTEEGSRFYPQDAP